MRNCAIIHPLHLELETVPSFSQSRNVRIMFAPLSLVCGAPAAGVGATDAPASA